MTVKLDPRKWYPFRDILMHPEVRAAGDKIRSDQTEPDWTDLFMGLCGLCQMAGPEEDLIFVREEVVRWDKYVMARQGAILFYVADGSTEVAEPWTLAVEIGGESEQFWLRGAFSTTTFSGDDVASDPRTLEILNSSLWRPINA